MHETIETCEDRNTTTSSYTSKEGETRWKNMTEQTIINKPWKEDLRSGAKRRQIHNIPESPLFFPFHTDWNASQKEHLLRFLASVCNSSELHPLDKPSFICTAQVKEINTIKRIEVYCKSKTQHVGIRQTQQKNTNHPTPSLTNWVTPNHFPIPNLTNKPSTLDNDHKNNSKKGDDDNDESDDKTIEEM